MSTGAAVRHYVAQQSDDATTLSLVDVRSNEQIQSLAVPDGVRCAQFTSSGKEVVIGTDNGTVLFFDTKTNRELRRIDHVGGRYVCAVDLSSDDRVMAVKSDNLASLWNVSEASVMYRLPNHESWDVKLIPKLVIICAVLCRLLSSLDPILKLSLLHLQNHNRIKSAAKRGRTD